MSTVALVSVLCLQSGPVLLSLAKDYLLGKHNYLPSNLHESTQH